MRNLAYFLILVGVLAGCGPSYRTAAARQSAYCPEFGAVQLLPEDDAYYAGKPPSEVIDINVAFSTEWASVGVGLLTRAQSDPRLRPQMLRAYRTVCGGSQTYPGWMVRQHATEVAKTKEYCRDWGQATLTSGDAALLGGDPEAMVVVRRWRGDGYAAMSEDDLQEQIRTPARLVAGGHKLQDDGPLWAEFRRACPPDRPAWYRHKLKAKEVAETQEEAEQDLAAFEKETVHPLREQVRRCSAEIGETRGKLASIMAVLPQMAAEYAAVKTISYEIGGRIATRQPDRIYLAGADAIPESIEEAIAEFIEEGVERKAPGMLSGGPAVLLHPLEDDVVQGVEVHAAGVYFTGLSQAVNQYGQKSMVFTYTRKTPPNPKADDLAKRLRSALSEVSKLKERIDPCERAQSDLAAAEEEAAEQRKRIEKLKAGVQRHERAMAKDRQP